MRSFIPIRSNSRAAVRLRSIFVPYGNYATSVTALMCCCHRYGARRRQRRRLPTGGDMLAAGMSAVLTNLEITPPRRTAWLGMLDSNLQMSFWKNRIMFADAPRHARRHCEQQPWTRQKARRRGADRRIVLRCRRLSGPRQIHCQATSGFVPSCCLN
jgi:hypothetical protein